MFNMYTNWGILEFVSIPVEGNLPLFLPRQRNCYLVFPFVRAIQTVYCVLKTVVEIYSTTMMAQKVATRVGLSPAPPRQYIKVGKYNTYLIEN